MGGGLNLVSVFSHPLTVFSVYSSSSQPIPFVEMMKKRSTLQQPIRRSERLRARRKISQEETRVQVSEGEHSDNIGCWPPKQKLERSLSGGWSYSYSSETKRSSCTGSYSAHSWDASREFVKACNTLELLRQDGLLTDEKLFHFCFNHTFSSDRFAQAVNLWRSHEELISFLRGEFVDYQANSDRSFMRWM